MFTSMDGQTTKVMKGNWEFLLFYAIVISTITMAILTLDYSNNPNNSWSSIAVLFFISLDMLSYMILNEALTVSKDKNSEVVSYIRTLGLPITWIILVLCLLASVGNYFL